MLFQVVDAIVERCADAVQHVLEALTKARYEHFPLTLLKQDIPEGDLVVKDGHISLTASFFAVTKSVGLYEEESV